MANSEVHGAYILKVKRLEVLYTFYLRTDGI